MKNNLSAYEKVLMIMSGHTCLVEQGARNFEKFSGLDQHYDYQPSDRCPKCLEEKSKTK